MTLKKYPESKAVETWRKGDLKFSVVYNAEMGHYCGYVRFPKRPVRERGYNGILTYVPVHGGITYAEHDENGTVYGFDCGHSNDNTALSTGGKEWFLVEVKNEAEKMAKAIQLIVKYEKRYLRNITNKGKAKVLDEYHQECKKEGIIFNLQDNFGAMLNLLGGNL